jgi:hypothetical protein
VPNLSLLGIPFHPFPFDLFARLDYFVVFVFPLLLFHQNLFIPSGCSAVMRVKVDFLDDPKASAALSLGDLTFIIEEPRPSFFTPACK